MQWTAPLKAAHTKLGLDLSWVVCTSSIGDLRPFVLDRALPTGWSRFFAFTLPVYSYLQLPTSRIVILKSTRCALKHLNPSLPCPLPVAVQASSYFNRIPTHSTLS